MPQQEPQSFGQLVQLSPFQLSHLPSPHATGQVPQSLGHELQVSVPLQLPSPQVPGQVPQSAGQELHDSEGSQLPSPQLPGQVPQSAGHELHDSSELQLPSPHFAQVQSEGQLWQLSPGSQLLSPHQWQTPFPSHWQAVTPSGHCPWTCVLPQPPATTSPNAR